MQRDRVGLCLGVQSSNKATVAAGTGEGEGDRRECSNNGAFSWR